MSTVTDAALSAIIKERLEAIHVEVNDTSGQSGLFSGLSSLKRHRRVNAALKDEIAVIHAWSAKCQTPEEWERVKAATTAAAAAATADSGTAPTYS
ncbi:BolA protein [Ophiocordyceps camponoti-floridani]|uniref:BolA protein n=1 Tax=Ophiocordyceps camponoti-floridani TaxID=2030778 RepID=A0A8H4Q7K6_9HYPO|nr:BolA protein [Ophiocordyceps camponoti-floridani]